MSCQCMVVSFVSSQANYKAFHHFMIGYRLLFGFGCVVVLAANVFTNGHIQIWSALMCLWARTAGLVKRFLLYMFISSWFGCLLAHSLHISHILSPAANLSLVPGERWDTEPKYKPPSAEKVTVKVRSIESSSPQSWNVAMRWHVIFNFNSSSKTSVSESR